MVVIELTSDEKQTERLVKSVTEAIEKSLRTIPQVTEMSSQTGHGTIAIEVHFKDGATRHDLRAVEERIEQVKNDGNIVPASWSTRLALPALIKQ